MKLFYLNFGNKKIIASILLLFIIAGLVMPKTTQASTGACVWGVLAGTVAAIGTGIITAGAASIPVGAAIIATGCGVGLAAESSLTSGKANFLSDIIAAVADIVYAATHMLAVQAADLLTTIVTLDSLNKPISTIGAYQKGWAMVRDLANMFIVLGFVFTGVAFTLRLEGYGTKKTLITLIGIALLINFSGLISGILIDASNILTKYFLLAGGNNSGTIVVEGIEKTVAANDWDAIYKTDVRTYLAWKIFYSFYYVMAIITFFYLGFILFAKQAIFGILFVLSPLAFFCFVFPPTKKLWSMWWDNFIKWGLIGAQVGFFTWLAASMLGNPNGFTLNEALGVLVLLFVATHIARKSSAVGAGAVIGLASGVLGYAMGAGAGLAKLGGKGAFAGADKLTRGKLSGGVQALKGTAARNLERLGLRKEGITGMKEGAAIAEEQKRYEAMFKSGNASDKARAKQAALTGRGRNKAGAIAAAVATDNINDVYKHSDGTIDTEAMNRGLVHTEQFGAGESLRKNTTKQNPNIAAFNEPKVRENLEKMGYTGPIDKAPTKQRELAERQALAQAVQNTTPGDATKWDANVITPEVFAAMRTNQLIEIGKRGKPGAIEQVKRYKHDPTKPLSGQSSEWVKARLNIMKSGPAGSPERKATENQFANLQKQLATNDLFL